MGCAMRKDGMWFAAGVLVLRPDPQPVEVVVNFIGKDAVRGYVSEPRYKRSELSQGAPTAAVKPLQFSTR